MALKFRFLLVFISIGAASFAQEWTSNFTNFVGSGQSNDLGLSITHFRKLDRNAISINLEMRSIDWGNQFNVGVGYLATYKEAKNWEFGGHTQLLLGIAPFKQKSIMAYGLAYAPYFRYKTLGRLFVEGSLGFRYNIAPGYSDYGIFQQIEFPLQLSLGLAPKNQD